MLLYTICIAACCQNTTPAGLAKAGALLKEVERVESKGAMEALASQGVYDTVITSCRLVQQHHTVSALGEGKAQAIIPSATSEVGAANACCKCPHWDPIWTLLEKTRKRNLQSAVMQYWEAICACEKMEAFQGTSNVGDLNDSRGRGAVSPAGGLLRKTEFPASGIGGEAAVVRGKSGRR